MTETEAALYALLQSLRSEANGTIAERSPIDTEEVVKHIEKINESTSRNERLAAWKRLPLSASADLERWRAENENLQQTPNGERKEPTLHRQVSGFPGVYRGDTSNLPSASDATFTDSVASAADEFNLVSPDSAFARLATSEQRKYF